MAQLGRPTNRLATSALQANQDRLKPPAGKPQAFTDLWDTVVGDFPAGYFIPSDATILEQYVDVSLRIKELDSDLAIEGIMVMGRFGPIPNPRVAMQSELRRTQIAYARMLRVGPSTRLDQSTTGVAARKAAQGVGAPLASVVPIAGVGKK